ncbi:unnamed protein product, partial [marine sediment metagenome]
SHDSGGSLNSYFDDASLELVPEPKRMILLAAGLLGLFVLGRRRRS